VIVYWPPAIPGLGPARLGPFSRCELCGTGTWVFYGALALCLACARAQAGLDPDSARG